MARSSSWKEGEDTIEEPNFEGELFTLCEVTDLFDGDVGIDDVPPEPEDWLFGEKLFSDPFSDPKSLSQPHPFSSCVGPAFDDNVGCWISFGL